jgi:hypothetical protein
MRCLLQLAMSGADDPRIRQVFMDGMDDPKPFWRGMCAILGASLGPDTDLQFRVEQMATLDPCVDASLCPFYTPWTESDDAKLMAGAAMVILGDPTYREEVASRCLGHASAWARMFCAGALGVAGEDAPVQEVLQPMVADDFGFEPLMSSYVLQWVAKHRRMESGCVSFYGDCGDGGPPDGGSLDAGHEDGGQPPDDDQPQGDEPGQDGGMDAGADTRHPANDAGNGAAGGSVDGSCGCSTRTALPGLAWPFFLALFLARRNVGRR